MNAPLIPPLPSAPVLAAPRKYTAADVFYLLQIGLIDRAARFELIDGEFVGMSPKGRFHEAMREQVAYWLQSVCTSGFRSLQEHTLVLADGLILEPDFILYNADRRIADAPLTGAELRLVIEVADTSWTHDAQTKAALYAAHGAPEYWVIEAVQKTVRVHRAGQSGAPSPGWGDIQDIKAGDAIAPLCAPDAPFSTT